jgi:ribosomal protein S18 acetylase RimI-like enzyme
MKIEQPIIQCALPSDARALAELAKDTFLYAFARLNNRKDIENYVAISFTEKQIRTEILDRTTTFFIARLRDQWVGYSKICQTIPPDCIDQLPAIELSRLYTMPNYYGCGIGPALLEACLNHARKKGFKSVWLGSWQKNKRGNAFYGKMNFEIVGVKQFILGSDIQEDYVFLRSLY